MRPPDCKYGFEAYGQVAIGLLIAFCLQACTAGTPAPPQETPKHPSALQHAVLEPTFSIRIAIGNVVGNGPRTQRLEFHDSLRVEVRDSLGKPLALLRAKSGVTDAPFKEVYLDGCLWECEDGTQIEAQQIVWICEDKETPIFMPGEIKVITSREMLTGAGLRGDLLVSGFVIHHIESIVRWDHLRHDPDSP